jgi:anti-sigma B factor antagonist
MSPDRFTIETRPGKSEGVRILKLSGPFTLPSIADFRSATQNDTSPVTILDVSEVPYMDSAALGSLLGFHMSCERNKRRYFVAGATDRVMTLFRLAGAVTVLVLADSVEDAETRAASA